jgi:hypothetical protein
MIENNHNGHIVLFLYPTPKSLSEPSRLYKNAGCNICIEPKMIKNIIIDTKVVLFLVNVLNIYIIITFFYNNIYFMYLYIYLLHIYI